MINRILSSQSGFSLVQGMIIAGVVAGSSLVATRMLTDQKLSQKTAETRDSIDQVHGLVYSVLQNKDHCSRTLQAPLGTTLVTGTTGSPRTVAVASVTTNNGSSVVAVHDGTLNTVYMNGHVTIKSINAVYPAVDPTGVMNTGYGKFEVTYQRLNGQNELTKRSSGQGYGAKEIKKIVTMRVQRTGGVFTSCYGVTSNDASAEDGNNDLNRKFCEELNSVGNNTTTSMFVWDEANSTCRPRNNTCPTGTVNTGINSNGLAECRTLNQWMDFGQVIDNSASPTCPVNSSPRFEVVGNKVRIRCN